MREERERESRVSVLAVGEKLRPREARAGVAVPHVTAAALTARRDTHGPQPPAPRLLTRARAPLATAIAAIGTRACSRQHGDRSCCPIPRFSHLAPLAAPGAGPAALLDVAFGRRWTARRSDVVWMGRRRQSLNRLPAHHTPLRKYLQRLQHHHHHHFSSEKKIQQYLRRNPRRTRIRRQSLAQKSPV